MDKDVELELNRLIDWFSAQSEDSNNDFAMAMPLNIIFVIKAYHYDKLFNYMENNYVNKFELVNRQARVIEAVLSSTGAPISPEKIDASENQVLSTELARFIRIKGTPKSRGSWNSEGLINALLDKDNFSLPIHDYLTANSPMENYQHQINFISFFLVNPDYWRYVDDEPPF